MGLYKFLKSLRTLARNGDLTIDDAYRFAQQEFGEITDLLKLQINKIFVFTINQTILTKNSTLKISTLKIRFL